MRATLKVTAVHILQSLEPKAMIWNSTKPERLNSRGEILDWGCNILEGYAKLCGDRAPTTAHHMEKKYVNLTKL